MSMTLTEARDQITELFTTAWATTGHTVVFDDKPGSKPTTEAPWARFLVRHAAGAQGSLAGDNGRRRWTRTGFVTVQIFTPIGEGLSRSDVLAKIVLDAYEGQTTSGGAWFRNARANEIGPDGDWFQVNVLVDFEYDEVK